ncbi:hypothetical protein B0T17DRAFT_494562 [Bombardia bombarda]|uniref:Nucleoside-diphosphate-sugar epimerase n=1 Tax=Bombardia bombarda TaxID=252184 RepID=A0AA39WUT3_9PEZI|nr:hypothetical protein B0T17DRAFT_494562 [Bombardia bombarda]
MHLILTGATGLVGSAVLDAMIKMTDVTKISIISRRPVQMAEAVNDPRVNVIIHKDFSHYDSELLNKVRDATGCVWALGISQSQVSKEEYVVITKDYALAAAKAFQTLPSLNLPETSPNPSSQQTALSNTSPATSSSAQKPFNFVYVSGLGATFQPGPFTATYSRVKGETELLLAEMRRQHPLFRASTMRPAYINYAAHDAIKPFVPKRPFLTRTMESLVGPVISLGISSMNSPTGPLGRFLTEMAMGRWDGELAKGKAPGFEQLEGGFTVVNNVGFRELKGLVLNG